MSPADTRALEVGRVVLALLAVLLPSESAARPDDLLPIVEAARVAATSVRVVKDAVRHHELPAVGRQRDRAVRRKDLEAWIESRRLRPVAGPQDADLERRIARLSRRGRAA